MFISRRMDKECRVHIQQYVNAMMNPITIYANLFLIKGHSYIKDHYLAILKLKHWHTIQCHWIS